MALSADPQPPLPPVGTSPTDIGVASLYQEIILSHYRAPKHKGVLEGAGAGVEHRNPLCGDVLSLQLVVDGDRIADGAFSARACSITQATASMLLDTVIGGSVAEARAVLAAVEGLLEPGVAPSAEDAGALGDLRALASVGTLPRTEGLRAPRDGCDQRGARHSLSALRA
ncbi:MAG: SUF system NifU family Fe-S cluster assembly protein [Gemmatimonadaceae bacterium]|nr:SUF system NifU family Fe-S cluster assembly protein [Gemmatimonadaceae bacterium]